MDERGTTGARTPQIKPTWSINSKEASVASTMRGKWWDVKSEGRKGAGLGGGDRSYGS